MNKKQREIYNELEAVRIDLIKVRNLYWNAKTDRLADKYEKELTLLENKQEQLMEAMDGAKNG